MDSSHGLETLYFQATFVEPIPAQIIPQLAKTKLDLVHLEFHLALWTWGSGQFL